MQDSTFFPDYAQSPPTFVQNSSVSSDYAQSRTRIVQDSTFSPDYAQSPPTFVQNFSVSSDYAQSLSNFHPDFMQKSPIPS